METPETIAKSNFDMAIDQQDNYNSLFKALGAYLVNAIDTAEEYKVRREETASLFLALVMKINTKIEIKC